MATDTVNFSPRRLEFRSRDAIELVGEPLSNEQLRVYAEKTGKEPGDYHRKYSPLDVRMVREKLHPEFAKYMREEHRQKRNGLPPIITFHTSKGGTGKTSLSCNTAVCLVKLGYKVLLIDSDPQSSATLVMGFDPEDENLRTLRNVMTDSGSKLPVEEATYAIYDQDNAVLDFIPADLTLNRVEREITGLGGRSWPFMEVIEQNREHFAKYDFIIIDTNPGTTLLNFNMMLAAHMVVAPIGTDGLSVKAMASMSADLADIEKISKGVEREVMVLINQYNPNLRHTKQNAPLLDGLYKHIIANAKIPSYAGFSRQVKLGPKPESAPLVEQEPTAPASKALLEFARELADIYVPRTLFNG